MTEITDTPKAGWRMKFAIFAVCASVFGVLWLVVAALGTKWGWWPYQVGLLQMTFGIAPMIFIGSIILGVIAQIIGVIKAPRFRVVVVALLGTFIGVLGLLRIMGTGARAAALPPIHDVQTDWSEPIQFSSAILTAREAQGETNPIADDTRIPDAEGIEARWPGMGGKLVSEVQEEAELKKAGKGTVLPKMEPLFFDETPAEMAALSQRLMERRGWEIVTPAPTSGDTGQEILLEATATSGWFGFKDDVAVRIRPVEGATRVDMRSISRVGLSDLGANSKRVYGMMMELQDRADGRTAP
jgi:fatty-acyl-CoA synthase